MVGVDVSHAHSHSHHGHHHHHEPSDHGRAFLIGILLNVGFVMTEFYYGKVSHSLALVADAGHNLSDVLSLMLAWGGAILSKRQPTPNRTYGLRRSSILASLTNAVVLLIALGAIAWESLQRFANPAPVAEGLVMGVAAVGIVINGATALLFFSGRKGDVNVRGAFLHMLTDAAVSAGVVASGFAMGATGWLWLDPVVSITICVLIFMATWGLLKDSLNLALDAVPDGISIEEVRQYLLSQPNVVGVHDLHVWAMSTTETALTAHLVRQEAGADNQFLRLVERGLHDRFGIEHATLQVETGESACECRLIC